MSNDVNGLFEQSNENTWLEPEELGKQLDKALETVDENV